MRSLLAIAVALQAAEPQATVSLDRLRAQLAQPAALPITIPDLPRPTFRVEVHEHPYWIDDPLAWHWDMPPMSPLVAPGSAWLAGGGAGGGTDVLPAIKAARRSRQLRAARREVVKDFADFCASHDCSRSDQPRHETPGGSDELPR